MTGADWRVGDAEREAVAGQLREHYAAGRLTIDEFQARLDAAYSAATATEIAGVTADLPSTGVDWASGGARSPGSSTPHRSPGTSGGHDLSRPSRPPRTRRHRRRGPAFLLVFAALVVGGALIVNSLPHGGLLLLAILVACVPLVLLTALAATLIWIGRRAWRSGAWLEAVPVAAGVPWLGRAVWLARAALVGRAFWRLGGRARARHGRRQLVPAPMRNTRAFPAAASVRPGSATSGAPPGNGTRVSLPLLSPAPPLLSPAPRNRRRPW